MIARILLFSLLILTACYRPDPNSIQVNAAERGKQLVFAGRAGSGIDEADVRRLVISPQCREKGYTIREVIFEPQDDSTANVSAICS